MIIYFKNSLNADLDPILNELRNDLRSKLKIKRTDLPVWWINVTKKE